MKVAYTAWGAIDERPRTRLPLLILGLVLLGLARAPAGAQSVRFAVIGDYGGDSQAELDVANMVHRWNPDFIITVGDNNYEYGEASTIDRNIGQYYHDYIYPYTGSYGAGASTNRFFPSLGNHDWGNAYPNPTGAQPYLNYFRLPNNGRYYEALFSPVDLFALDSDDNEPDGNTSTSTQASWLQRHLAASTAPWKLVYCHHSPYSSGSEHGSSPWMQWPFQAWGATAVLSGHDHDYERLLINGFPYFVAGLGGESIYSFGSSVAGSQVQYSGDYGAMLVTADMSSITFRFYNRTGGLIDTYTLSAPNTPTAPAAPSGLTASAASSSQVNLTWTDNSDNETAFAVWRQGGGAAFARVAVLAPNSTSFTDSGLTPGTAYTYEVRAINNAGASPWSNQATVTLAGLAPPAAPSNLAVSSFSAAAVALTWTDNSNNETAFAVWRSAGGGAFGRIAALPPHSTSYTDTAVSAGTSYSYEVRAINNVGASPWSNQATVTPTGLPPAAPTNLTATAAGPTQITLTWTDNSNNETAFAVWRQGGGGGAFGRVAALAANTTSFTDTGLTPGTAYSYEVRAISNAGASPWSNQVTGTTSP